MREQIADLHEVAQGGAVLSASRRSAVTLPMIRCLVGVSRKCNRTSLCFNAPCLKWPAPAQRPVQVASGGSGRAIHSALLIDETLDAATPFPGSLEVRRLFPNSVLLAEPGGTSHADSLFGNLCVDGAIASYLETGKLPPRKPHAEWDITCQPLPIPNPTAQTAAPASMPANSAAARAAR